MPGLWKPLIEGNVCEGCFNHSAASAVENKGCVFAQVPEAASMCRLLCSSPSLPLLSGSLLASSRTSACRRYRTLSLSALSQPGTTRSCGHKICCRINACACLAVFEGSFSSLALTARGAIAALQPETKFLCSVLAVDEGESQAPGDLHQPAAPRQGGAKRACSREWARSREWERQGEWREGGGQARARPGRGQLHAPPGTCEASPRREGRQGILTG